MKMTTVVVILSVIAIIGGTLLNLERAFWNVSATIVTIKNLIVTISYLSVWGLVFLVAVKRKSRKILIYFSIFWILTLIYSVISIFASITHFQIVLDEHSWYLLSLLLLYVPFFGMRYFTDSFLSLDIIMMAISLGMSMVGIILLRRFKRAAQ